MARKIEHVLIDNETLKKSPNQMYRAYIFNFQQDMWQYVYKARDHNTTGRDKAAKNFFKVLKANVKLFKKHLKDPDDVFIIEYHVQMIDQWMNSLLDDFVTKKDKASVFYRAVKHVHDEFAM